MSVLKLQQSFASHVSYHMAGSDVPGGAVPILHVSVGGVFTWAPDAEQRLVVEGSESPATMHILRALWESRGRPPEGAGAKPVAWRSYGKMSNGVIGWRFATDRSTFHDDPGQQPLFTEPVGAYTLDQIAEACAKAEVPASVYEAISIALEKGSAQ